MLWILLTACHFGPADVVEETGIYLDSDTDSDTWSDSSDDTGETGIDTEDTEDTGTFSHAPIIGEFRITDQGGTLGVFVQVQDPDGDLEGGLSRLDLRVNSGPAHTEPFPEVFPISLDCNGIPGCGWSEASPWWTWSGTMEGPARGEGCSTGSYEASAQVFDAAGNASPIKRVANPLYSLSLSAWAVAANPRTGDSITASIKSTDTLFPYSWPLGGLHVDGWGTVCSWSCDRAWVTNAHFYNGSNSEVSPPAYVHYADPLKITLNLTGTQNIGDLATCTFSTSAGVKTLKLAVN